MAYLSTLQSPLLTEFYSSWYTGGEWVNPPGNTSYIRGATKIIPERIMKINKLSTQSLAHLFLNDGGSYWDHRARYTTCPVARISLCGFTEGEVSHFVILLNNMGVEFTEPLREKVERGSGLTVQVIQHSTKRFMDLVEPHILEIFGDSESPSYKDIVKRKSSILPDLSNLERDRKYAREYTRRRRQEKKFALEREFHSSLLVKLEKIRLSVERS